MFRKIYRALFCLFSFLVAVTTLQAQEQKVPHDTAIIHIEIDADGIPMRAPSISGSGERGGGNDVKKGGAKAYPADLVDDVWITKISSFPDFIKSEFDDKKGNLFHDFITSLHKANADYAESLEKESAHLTIWETNAYLSPDNVKEADVVVVIGDKHEKISVLGALRINDVIILSHPVFDDMSPEAKVVKLFHELNHSFVKVSDAVRSLTLANLTALQNKLVKGEISSDEFNARLKDLKVSTTGPVWGPRGANGIETYLRAHKIDPALRGAIAAVRMNPDIAGAKKIEAFQFLLQGEHREELLNLNYPSLVKSPLETGMTPDAVKLLIVKSPEAKDLIKRTFTDGNDSKNLFCYAVESGNLNMVKDILDLGSDPTSPLQDHDLAWNSPQPPLVQVAWMIEVEKQVQLIVNFELPLFDLLIEHGAQPDNKKGEAEDVMLGLITVLIDKDRGAALDPAVQSTLNYIKSGLDMNRPYAKRGDNILYMCVAYGSLVAVNGNPRQARDFVMAAIQASSPEAVHNRDDSALAALELFKDDYGDFYKELKAELKKH